MVDSLQRLDVVILAKRIDPHHPMQAGIWGYFPSPMGEGWGEGFLLVKIRLLAWVICLVDVKKPVRA
jgi:hypothetical protein